MKARRSESVEPRYDPGPYVRATNVAARPGEVTEEDCEKLLEWMDRRWGKKRRDEFEANRWASSYLSSFTREALAYACRELKDQKKRPTIAQIRLKCFEYVPPKQADLL